MISSRPNLPHWKIEWFNEGSKTCDRSCIDFRFSTERIKQKALAFIKHFGYQKAYIFTNIPVEDIEKELIGLYKPEFTITD